MDDVDVDNAAMGVIPRSHHHAQLAFRDSTTAENSVLVQTVDDAGGHWANYPRPAAEHIPSADTPTQLGFRPVRRSTDTATSSHRQRYRYPEPMTRRDRVLGEHRDAILAAAAANKATSIALVGSVARGEDTSHSDYDFLANFADGASLFDHAGLELALEDLLGAEVDVISRGGLKPKHAGILADAIPL